jgi:hypothetical protein
VKQTQQQQQYAASLAPLMRAACVYALIKRRLLSVCYCRYESRNGLAGAARVVGALDTVEKGLSLTVAPQNAVGVVVTESTATRVRGIDGTALWGRGMGGAVHSVLFPLAALLAKKTKNFHLNRCINERTTVFSSDKLEFESDEERKLVRLHADSDLFELSTEVYLPTHQISDLVFCGRKL